MGVGLISQAGLSRRVTGTLPLLCCLLWSGCAWFAPGKSSRPMVDTPEPWSPQPVEAAEGLPADVPPLLSRAENLLKRGKADEALFYFVKVLSIEPQNIQGLLGVGSIHRAKGNTDLADLAYGMVLKQQPRNAGALEGMGLTRLASNSRREAENYLSAAVKADPRRWQAHNALGLLASESGQYVQAISHYEQALQVKPRNAECLNNLGFAKYESRDWMGALRAYDAALTIDPRFESAWMNKALLMARQGDDQAALAAFRRVMTEADAYNDLGYIHMTEGDVDGAYELFEKAITASPTFHVKANENLRRLKSGEFNRAGSGR